MELEIGSVLDGKVTGITKFGAFVSLPGGRSGLVHISEIAYSYVSDVAEHLQEGQDVKVKVIGIDDNNRINLSIKKAVDPPPRPAPRPMSVGQGMPPRQGGPRPGGPRPGGFSRQSAEPESFEDRLKLFMQSSDSKLSDMRHLEKKNSRRGGGSKK